MSSSHTLAQPAELLQTIRKSRFLAHAGTVDTPEAALAFVARVSVADATHNCWAYRIGQDYRFNDDGEPGGTAGKPILLAIDGQQLDRVVVVVTRWFGGTKLGAGGLMRAYGGCAAECLRLAPRRELIDYVELDVECDFAALPVLHARLDEVDGHRLQERFDAAGVALHIKLPREQLAAFGAYVRDLTRGRGVVRVRDQATPQ